MNLKIKKIYFIGLLGTFAFFVFASSAFGQTVEQKIQARQQFLGVRAEAKSVMIQSINNAIALRKLGDIEIAKAAFVQAVLGRVNDILYPIFGSAYSSPGPLPTVASSAFVEKTTSPLTVTCSASPLEININQSVVWSAVYSGGNASYSFSWSGSDGLSGAESAITKTYSSAGRKTGSVAVSSGGQTVNKDCGAVSVTDPSSMIQKVLTFIGLGKTATSTSPIACGDGNIGSWSTCSATCGGGTQSRTIVGSDCATHSESQSCNATTCPPPCGNGSVSDWSSCSTSCGGGTQTRTVTNPDCSTRNDSQSCNTDICPKNSPACGGGIIGSWSDCSVSCGGGTQTRRITQPDCTIYTDSQVCNTEACPPACGSGNVGNWSTCSAVCGGGTQTRTVTNPNCSTHSESQSCNINACPPACGVGSFGAWSPCSAACDGGTQTRAVTNPDCSTRTDSQSCNNQSCPPVCTASTGSWSSCSATCSGGTQTRTIIAASCGSTTETQSCNTQACVITPFADIKANGSDWPISASVNEKVNFTWTSGGGITACQIPDLGNDTNRGVSGSAQSGYGFLYGDTQIFHLNCSGPNGISVSDNVTVNFAPIPPITVTISAGSSNVSYNSGTTITWNSTGGGSCVVLPENWIGTSGSQSTGNLTSSKTYTVICSDSRGSVSGKVVVFVAEPTPVIDYFGIDPTSVTIPYAFYTGNDQSIKYQTATTLRWSSLNTVSCGRILLNGTSLPSGGSLPVTWEYIRSYANAWGYKERQLTFNLYCIDSQNRTTQTSSVSLTIENPYLGTGPTSCPNGVIVDGVCQSSNCSVLGIARSSTFCQRAYTCVGQGGSILVYNGIFYCSAPAFRISD